MLLWSVVVLCTLEKCPRLHNFLIFSPVWGFNETVGIPLTLQGKQRFNSVSHHRRSFQEIARPGNQMRHAADAAAKQRHLMHECKALHLLYGNRGLLTLVLPATSHV